MRRRVCCDRDERWRSGFATDSLERRTYHRNIAATRASNRQRVMTDSSTNGTGPRQRDGQHELLPRSGPRLTGDGQVSGEDAAVLAGDPQSEVRYWHEQHAPDTCAIVSQDFVIESLGHEHVTEDTLVADAERHGWYRPGEGTPQQDLDCLLLAHGIPAREGFAGGFAEIVAQLDEGDKVIAGVNGEDLWGATPRTGERADHAVEVIGVIDTGGHEMVVLNDPGIPHGCGEMVPLDVFEHAWGASGDFMVEAGPGVEPAHSDGYTY